MCIRIEKNLLIQGINEFSFLVVNISQGKGSQDYEDVYKKHIDSYKKLKSNSDNAFKVKKLIKNGSITPFKLVVPENHLSAAIHFITEIIAGREFSCDFSKYTSKDLKQLRDAMGLLWEAGISKKTDIEVFTFN